MIASDWREAQFIEDPYTDGSKGEVDLNLNTLWSFDLIRADNFRRFKFGA